MSVSTCSFADEERGRFGDQCSLQARSVHTPRPSRDLDVDRLRSVERPLPARRRDRPTTRHTDPVVRSLAEEAWDEDVDLGVALQSSVLHATCPLEHGRCFAGRLEPQRAENRGEVVEDSRLCADVEHGVSVLSGPGRDSASLPAQRMHHLPAHECPSTRVAFVDLEQRVPRCRLGRCHGRCDDRHDARWRSSATRDRSRTPSCPARSTKSNPSGSGDGGFCSETCNRTLGWSDGRRR